MHSAPPEIIERIVSFLIPPSSREEVLGDLYEGCTSSGQYIQDAIRVVPMVILSRIRRTADPQVLLMEAVALYMSYMGTAWRQAPASIYEHYGLLRLAIPSAMILFGIVIEDAYTDPSRRSLPRLMRGPVLGVGFAYMSQWALSLGSQALALPAWVMLCGSAISLLFSLAVRSLFPPPLDRPLGISGPTLWLKHAAEPLRITPVAVSAIKGLALIVVALVAARVGGLSPTHVLVLLSVLLVVVLELSRRR
ncbi:MAG: hypothetical protein M3Y24_05665 [Acidobacteriota bacterium]|nr:hypothetical protein [Acidobacteriota bacterium]